ncbi:MAG: extracellular solute-binding protein [Phycisphaerales bacterium]|nr:extracellular solute-binding protein [Phycisphaerales bacterium]
MKRGILSRIGRAFRWIVGVLTASLLAFSFCWVGSRPFRQQQLDQDQVQLTVLHWGEKNEDKIVADLVEDFERRPENQDIRILRINLGQAAAVNTKLQTMFAAGDPPDVFYLGFEKVADLASKNLLADMEAFIAQDNAACISTINLNDFFPSVLRCFRYDAETRRIGNGTLIGLPKDFTTVGFYYNKDLFRRAGVPEPSPKGWTWDEFITAARAIGRLPNCYGADFATWEAMVRLYLWNHGHDFATSGWEEFKFRDAELRAVMKKLRSWFHDEARTLVSAKTQLETGQEPFLAGNVGMAGPFGRWKVPTYRLIKDFDWDFAPLPHAEGYPPRNGVFTVGWAIARDSHKKEEAWRFIKHLNSKHSQSLMCEAGLAIPVLKSVAEGPTFSDSTRKPRNYRVFLDAAEHAQPIDWPPDPKYLHQLRVRLEDIFKQGKPVGENLDRVEREWLENRKHERDQEPMPWATVTWFVVTPLIALFVLALWRWWRSRPRGLLLQEEIAGSLMISPWVIGFLVFTAFPIVLSLLLAFTKWNGLTTLGHAEWVGLENYRALWAVDETFRQSLKVTALYAMLAVPTSQLAALFAAMLLNRESRTIGVHRAIWYLPSVLAGVGMAVMWKWVFHHEHGLIKTLVDPILPFGLESPAWFEKNADDWGVPAFAIINLWAIGGTMMIYLAGLKGIPKDMYEAAEIDGATGWRRFANVTLPMLSPVIFFNVIIAVITSFQVFTQAHVMTGGGPGDATRFYVVRLYNLAFDFHEMGYASAMAWMLLLIVLALTLFLMWSSKRFVYYEGLK